jgi:hypothetical protein
MQAWQDKHGNDQDIANVVGLRRNDVRYRRLVFDVPALKQVSPAGKVVEVRFREVDPKQLVTDDEMAELYYDEANDHDRTYDDVGAA